MERGQVKIETKRPPENIDKAEYVEQAFKYEEETTKYIGLTNFLRLKLWEIKKTGSELRVDVDFSRILEQKRKPSEEQIKQLRTLKDFVANNVIDMKLNEKLKKH
jgi:hypothetical protein